jgi:hypothetical protein
MTIENAIQKLKDLMQVNVYELPSSQDPTIYGEATQHLNPITGKPYADGSFMPECEIRRIKNVFHEDSFYERKGKYFSNSNLESNLEKPTRRHQTPRTNETIELQKALGRMEAREAGYDLFYELFLDEVDALADAYAKNPDLTLESITDVNGLNTAISVVERAKRPKDFELFFPYLPENFNLSIKKKNLERFSKDKPWAEKHELDPFVSYDFEKPIHSKKHLS